MGRLIVINEGSLDNSPSSLSAAGQDEQPWLVNSSIIAREPARTGDASEVEQAAITAKARQRRIMPISAPRVSCPLHYTDHHPTRVRDHPPLTFAHVMVRPQLMVKPPSVPEP